MDRAKDTVERLDPRVGRWQEVGQQRWEFHQRVLEGFHQRVLEGFLMSKKKTSGKVTLMVDG